MIANRLHPYFAFLQRRFVGAQVDFGMSLGMFRSFFCLITLPQFAYLKPLAREVLGYPKKLFATSESGR